MSLFQAVVFVDPHHAQVLQFDTEQVQEQKLHAHRPATGQHASGVRSGHQIFGQVCDALEGVVQVLITGGHQGLADFQHFVDTHRPQTAKHIVGYEVADHSTGNELVVIARKYFHQANLTVGTSGTS